jgi:hypothetical protein
MALHASRRRRSGATAVEAAFVLPVFLVFLFGLIEVCHMQMVSILLKNSCRAAARYGATEGRTNAKTTNLLRNQMGAAINPALVTVQIKDASGFDTGGSLPDDPEAYEEMPDINLPDAEPRQLFAVRATVNYNDVAILTLPWMGNVTLSGHVFMRHE